MIYESRDIFELSKFFKFFVLSVDSVLSPNIYKFIYLLMRSVVKNLFNYKHLSFLRI